MPIDSIDEYDAMIAAIRTAPTAQDAAEAACHLGFDGESVDALGELAAWLEARGVVFEA